MTWLTAIPGALKLVPRWLWLVLALAAAWHFALSWHAGKVKAHDTSVIAARDAQWQARLDREHADALAWKATAETLKSTISNEERSHHEADLRSHAADAGALLVRGAGQAAAPASCRPVDHPSSGTAASGHEQAASIAHVAGPEVSSGDWALVPWDWLVERGREHDDLLSEDGAWRNNDSRQRSADEQLRASATHAP